MREFLTQPTAFIIAIALAFTVFLSAVWALVRRPRRRASPRTKAAGRTTPNFVPITPTTVSHEPPGRNSAPTDVDDAERSRRTPFLETTSDTTEVEEVDALEEAEIFLSYGHHEAAANILHWHVQNNRDDATTFRQLLSLYLEQDDEARYMEVLESYVEHHGLTAAADSVANGMMQYPGNPLIRGLAQGIAGVDSATMDELMGTPREEAEVREEPKPSVTASTVIPFSGARTRDRIPPAGREADEAVALVNFHPVVDRLNALERLTLRSYQSLNQVDDLELGVQGFEVTTRALQWQIIEEPHHLNNYVELLTRYHRLGDIDAYTRVLWRLFWMMGDKGYSLRKRMLQHGLQLGRHRVLHGLIKVLLHETTLPRLAQRLGLEPSQEFLASGDLPLVATTDGQADSAPGKTPEEKLLTNATEMVEYGQADDALNSLEKALYRDPEQLTLYPTLLDLYVHSRDAARFGVFQQRILGGDVQPPLEIILRIIDTGKEMEAQPLRTGT